MRYDACIIGAGAEGLAAAATMAACGLKVIVLERDSRCGGRCAIREFHQGFRASPFADELAAIPSDIFGALGLARHGAILAPAPASTALWPDRHDLILPWANPPGVFARSEKLRREILDRAAADARVAPSRGWFAKRTPATPWPGEALCGRTLAQEIGEAGTDAHAHVMASLLAGRTCDTQLAGSAVQLLGGTGGGMVAGGLGRLGDALRASAEAAGAEISCGLEVSDIKRKSGRVVGAGLADGTEIAVRAVISTLDLKRTFLALFTWSDLPPALVERVGAFRPSPGTARLLLALETLPDLPAGVDPLAWRGPLHLVPSPDASADGYRAWRGGMVPERPPVTLRAVSSLDPSLAPAGAASVTLTLGAVPHTPFDGPWTKEKRDKLRDAALAIVEEVLPGTRARVLGAELIVPPDMEDALGVTGGDLAGGELAPDQMLGLRPFAQCQGSRTPIEGLYLAGPSSTLGPVASCASGVTAARAVMADFAAGRLK